jgi:putative membrane protein
MMFLGLAHLIVLKVLLLAAIALVVWLVVRKRRAGQPHLYGHHHPGHAGPPATPAAQLLDERLARGEIDVEDYLSRRAALAGERPNGTEYRPAPEARRSHEAPAADEPAEEDPTASI